MIRAVIYCRCSTEEESQQEALKKQVIEAKESVTANGWLLVDEYIESKSGTTSGKRREYQRLFIDLQSDKFDIVQIKSQDRLMRNTKDWYLFVDRLVGNGKKLYMYMERKFYTPDDALITGIKAILAEEYSKELSKKINNAHRNRQRRGESFILPQGTYGYQRQPDQSIIIVEEEAEVIRLMFSLCQTMGCHRIASMLEKEGYRDQKGRVFQEETIRRIIRNPIRCGTIVQNRRHFDFQLKQELKMPKEEWIIHREAIPAIVSEEAWELANAAMDKRAEKYRANEERPAAGGGKFELSGKIHCGLCGGTYYRASRKNAKDQTKIVEWKCQSYLRYGRNHDGQGCDNVHLGEQKLLACLEKICKTSYQNEGMNCLEMTDKVISVLKKAFADNKVTAKSMNLEAAVKKQEFLLQKLVDKLLEGVLSDDDYRKKKKEFEGRLHDLKEEQTTFRQAMSAEGEKERIHKMKERLETDIFGRAVLLEMLEEIECIEVYGEKLEVKFYNGDVREMILGKEFLYASQKEAERERIMVYMRENPCISAKEIARLEQISLSAVNYRIRKLRQQGKICFHGRGGHGEWMVREGE